MAIESTVHREILSQPEIWSATWRRLQESREALDSVLFSECWDALFFTGCGSTHYLSLAAANLHQSLTGQRTRGVPASEIAFFPAGVYPDLPRQRVLLVAISRSGWTTETLHAAQRHHERGLPVLAITCHGDSQLARESDAVLALDDAREESIPQTRSFTSMYLAAQYVAGVVAGDTGYLDALEHTPEFARQTLSESASIMQEVGGKEWDRVIFLGSGPYYGLACEGMLKLKEMALSWSEAYHFAEFRHGPISLVDGNSLIVGLLSDTEGDAERALLSDVRGLGGQTLAIGARLPGPEAATYSVRLTSDLRESARGALYLLPLQLLAYHHAILRGADPDRPRHLQQTVMLEGV